MIPGNHNSDSFGYNEKEVGGKLDSWASLFDSHFKGHVALISDPDIGFIDAGMAAKASGKMTMKDLGNPTKKEIDDLTTILKDLKKAGHFKAFWSTFQESVTFMQTGAVVVESMWSPAVTLLQEAQFPVRYAAPKEGFRGWGGGNAILTHVTGDKLDAAFDYLNWWNTPVPAGIMATQGYYNANISAAHEGLATNKALGGSLRRQLLAQGQGGHDAARRPRRQARHQGRRQARRRLLRGALGPVLRLELAGRQPRLPAAEVAGVHHRLIAGGEEAKPSDTAQRAATWPPAARRGGIPSPLPLPAEGA